MSPIVYKSSRFLVLLMALSVSTGMAAGNGSMREYQIAVQPLDQALRQFALSTGMDLLFSPELVAGQKSSRVSGSYSIDEALATLLDGTGLNYSVAGTRVVISRSGAAGVTSEVQDERGLRVAQSDDTAAGSTPTSSPEAASDEAEKDRLEEVLVTAQKREERLQNVPISISVLTGENLDRATVQGLTEALTRVPGVGINETYQGGGTQIAVRGVTAGGALFNGSSPVSYYIDSVPFGLVRQAIGPDLNPYDLERVEVLRGPQGTLYGASSQNGVVRVLTHDADLDAFGMKARTSVASTEDGSPSYRGDMAVNLPLIEGKLAARAVLGYQNLGGWIDRPTRRDSNDADIRNIRLKLNAQPTDALSLSLLGWRSRADYGGPSIADDNGRHSAPNPEPIATDFDTVGLKIGYDAAAFSITGMTSYLEYSNTIFADVSALVPNRLGETSLDAEVLSQEILLASTSPGAWRWTLGGMHRDAEDRQFQENRINGTLVGFPSDQTYVSKSFAVFGELTRLFLEGRLELTGGLRYFEDEVTAREDARNTGVPASQLVHTVDDFDALSPRVVLTWHANSSSTLYASYAEGFRSGVSQYGSVPPLNGAPFPAAKPDTLHNYEIGAKGSFADSRITYDTALYYIDWQDVQQSLTFPITPGNVTLVTALINAESASGIGFDFSLTARPFDGVKAGFNFSWNDLAVDSAISSFFGNPPVAVVLFDEGDRLNISPQTTAGVFVDYEFSLGGGGLLGRISASTNYTSAMDLRSIVSGAQRIGHGDSMLTGRIGFDIDKADRWTAGLYVNNVTNEQGSPVRFPFAVAITDWNTHIRPRTFGVQLEYRFN